MSAPLHARNTAKEGEYLGTPKRKLGGSGERHAQFQSRILLVASNEEKRQLLRSWLEERRFEIQEAPDLKHAVQMVSQRTFGAIVCDQRLKDGDGVQFLHWLRREVFTTPFLLLTELLLPGLKQRWDFDFLVAPIDSETFNAALGHLLGNEVGTVPMPSRSVGTTLTPVAEA
jgi:DNA-binding NtrC family response regulator